MCIIGILITILLPALQNARKSAEFAVCASKQSQIGKGLFLYHKNNQRLPYGERPIGTKSASWEIRVAPYMGINYSESFIQSNKDVAPRKLLFDFRKVSAS